MYKTLVVLLACLIEAVRTNPGYGMATPQSHNTTRESMPSQ